MSKTAVLFSGGKDSFFSLVKTLEMGTVEYVIGVQSRLGDAQLHAGSPKFVKYVGITPPKKLWKTKDQFKKS